MGNLVISILVVGAMLVGPLILLALIKIISRIFGDLSISFEQNKNNTESPLQIAVNWDAKSYPYKINRIKIDFTELVRGGRASSFSFTYEDKRYLKRPFVLPLKLSTEQLAMLTDNSSSQKLLSNSSLSVEIEQTNGKSIRKKIKKLALLKQINNSQALTSSNDNFQLLEAKEIDSWSVFTRVFPWREIVEVEVETKAAKPKAKAGKKVELDFVVTKVWIEPGCIVCDACEDEAPDVFQVLSDTCIVRDNAPLVDTAAIVAAAEGCPVDVIKFDQKAK